MGLRYDLDADIAEAFDTDLADAVTAFEGAREVKSNLTPLEQYQAAANGTLGDTQTLKYSGRGVFSDYSSYEIQADTVEATDVKLIALQSEVAEPPQRDDVINGYRVVNIVKDPAGATYEIQLRRV